MPGNSDNPKQLSFWPSVAVVAVAIPAMFWLMFRRIDGFALGFTGFLLLMMFAIEFLPRIKPPDPGAATVRRGRWDGLGVIWLLCIPSAPLLMWLISSLTVTTIENWKLILGIKTFVCSLLPLVCVLPLLRYVRGKRWPYALLILLVGTGFPLFISRNAVRDFIHGPDREPVSVVSVVRLHTVVRHRDVETDIVEVKLADGRTLEANTRVVHVSENTTEIVVLPYSGVILEAK